jgi:hypothetical protein
MARHVMTPARRAALRKAQLVSARNRRKRGVKSELKRAGRQTLSTAAASGSLARRSAVKRWKSPANQAKRKATRRRAYKAAAIGGAVAGGVSAAGVLYGYHSINKSIAATSHYKGTRMRQGGPRITRVRNSSVSHRKIKRQNRAADRHLHKARRNMSATFGTAHSPIRSSRALTGTKTRSLGTGPKGKATIRSRNYRARKRSRK